MMFYPQFYKVIAETDTPFKILNNKCLGFEVARSTFSIKFSLTVPYSSSAEDNELSFYLR